MSTAEHPDALTRRIEQLAAASVDEPEGEGAAVAALVGALRAEIGAVRAELGSLRSETGAVRSDLDGLGGRLTGSVAASRSETGTLVRRVAELSTRIDGVGGRVDDVRNGLPACRASCARGSSTCPARTGARLDELTRRGSERCRPAGSTASPPRCTARCQAALDREERSRGEQPAALEDARGALESRLAVLEDALDALSERIEALARDGASTTTGDAADARESGLAALDQRIADEGRDSAELLVGRLRDVTETRISELEDTLYDRLTGVLLLRQDELRREVLSALETARAEAERRPGGRRRSWRRRSRTALDGFGSVLDRSLAGARSLGLDRPRRGRDTARARRSAPSASGSPRPSAGCAASCCPATTPPPGSWPGCRARSRASSSRCARRSRPR